MRYYEGNFWGGYANQPSNNIVQHRAGGCQRASMDKHNVRNLLNTNPPECNNSNIDDSFQEDPRDAFGAYYHTTNSSSLLLIIFEMKSPVQELTNPFTQPESTIIIMISIHWIIPSSTPTPLFQNPLSNTSLIHLMIKLFKYWTWHGQHNKQHLFFALLSSSLI